MILFLLRTIKKLKLPKPIADVIFKILTTLLPVRFKRLSELYHWKSVKKSEIEFTNQHYHQFFTTYFNLNNKYYNNKNILDIGCGPRGSLEWADMTKQRIGLDPLANQYLKLGASKQKMTYINATAEDIPFEANYFDVISSFNSLDHVDHLNQAVKEVKRVLKPGGLFLLITDVNHEPTVNEPITFSWDITEKFKPDFEKIEEWHYEKGAGIYESIGENREFDHTNLTIRPGILVVKYKKL